MIPKIGQWSQNLGNGPTIWGFPKFQRKSASILAAEIRRRSEADAASAAGSGQGMGDRTSGTANLTHLPAALAGYAIMHEINRGLIMISYSKSYVVLRRRGVTVWAALVGLLGLIQAKARASMT
jgi:hypothetical protein